MEITFCKYEGTGNDFVMIDNRLGWFPKSDTKLVAHLCDRRFGIGGDGLILLENDLNTDFKMIYYNSDGNESSMCGNGGRCIVAFAKKMNVISNETTFIATDGFHYATIDEHNNVALQMKNVDTIAINKDSLFLDTGSPHHVTQVVDLDDFDVKLEGSKIRYSERYGIKGTNVNFVEKVEADFYAIRTYERGVEDETLSCGTGATAVALAMRTINDTLSNNIKIKVQGGLLEVSFKCIEGQFSDIFLKGPATFVFEGKMKLN